MVFSPLWPMWPAKTNSGVLKSSLYLPAVTRSKGEVKERPTVIKPRQLMAINSDGIWALRFLHWRWPLERPYIWCQVGHDVTPPQTLCLHCALGISDSLQRFVNFVVLFSFLMMLMLFVCLVGWLDLLMFWLIDCLKKKKKKVLGVGVLGNKREICMETIWGGGGKTLCPISNMVEGRNLKKCCQSCKLHWLLKYTYGMFMFSFSIVWRMNSLWLHHRIPMYPHLTGRIRLGGKLWLRPARQKKVCFSNIVLAANGHPQAKWLNLDMLATEFNFVPVKA